MKIKKINHGIASRVGNTIYINRRLDKWPKLKRVLIAHERRHTPSFKLKDFLMDLDNQDLKEVKREYYSFNIRNPSSWTEFLPFVWYGKVLAFNVVMCLLWALVVLGVVILNIIA